VYSEPLCTKFVSFLVNYLQFCNITRSYIPDFLPEKSASNDTRPRVATVILAVFLVLLFAMLVSKLFICPMIGVFDIVVRGNVVHVLSLGLHIVASWTK